MVLKQLSRKVHIDIYRHLAFAMVGGFFAGYAVLCRAGVLANAQTMNLVELVINTLMGNGQHVLIHLGSLATYVVGTMLTVFIPHFLHWNMRRVSPIITAFMAILLSFLPEDMALLVSLYPIFFAMSIQWSTFTGADGFMSSTIFSTNNTKQSSLALAEYLCHGDRAHLRKLRLYLFTILCFHLGVTISYFGVKWIGIPSSLLALPLLAWCYVLVVCEDQAETVTA